MTYLINQKDTRNDETPLPALANRSIMDVVYSMRARCELWVLERRRGGQYYNQPFLALARIFESLRWHRLCEVLSGLWRVEWSGGGSGCGGVEGIVRIFALVWSGCSMFDVCGSPPLFSLSLPPSSLSHTDFFVPSAVFAVRLCKSLESYSCRRWYQYTAAAVAQWI